jgi:release factor glutamine methyltransferase
VFDINKFDIHKYDLIVSNPPYIPTRDIKSLSKDIINYEPLIALNGGHDGLRLIKKVIYKASNLLKRNGLLAIEIGYGQYRKTSNLLYKHGFKETCKEYDNNRNVRCIISTKIKFL